MSRFKRFKSLASYPFFVFLIFSRNVVYKALIRASHFLNFNYPGLRFETRINKPDKDKINILCLGDSVTFGWNLKFKYSYPQLLNERLKHSKYKAVNLGVGGSSVKDALSRAKRDITRGKPYLAIVNFGLNDGMLARTKENCSTALRYSYKSRDYCPKISLKDFERYYLELIKLLDENKINILIAGISQVSLDYPQGKGDDFKKKQRQVYKIYNDKIKEISRINDVLYIGLWDLFEDAPSLNYFLDNDGIHPNKKGSQLISEKIYDFLKNNGLLD